MSHPERFDGLILGSGQGGKLLAWHLARSGKRVAVVERRWIGGSCPAVACLPSKNEIWSARIKHLAHHAARFGAVTGSAATDMAGVRQRKREMIDRATAFHLQAYKTSGAELIMGEGRFVAPKTIELRLNEDGTRMPTGDQVFINVGSHAIIEPGPQLMRREDPDVADEVRHILSEEGIQVLLGAAPIKVHGRSGKDVTVTVRAASGEQEIAGSDLLIAVGRIPNAEDIGLEKTGVELDARRYIRVNERLETIAPDIWVIGECAGSPQFTHASVDDFRIIRDNLAGGNRRTGDRLVPYCMFTDPPLAHVGLREVEAKRQGLTVRVAKLLMSSVLRTEAADETQGFITALVNESDDRILGFTMIGSEADEALAAVQMAMLAGLSYAKLRDAVISHQTFAEGLGPLLANVPPRRA